MHNENTQIDLEISTYKVLIRLRCNRMERKSKENVRFAQSFQTKIFPIIDM